MEQAQVVIIGAGPVGLINALGLAQAGVRVTVLEAESAIIESPRAPVYHWSLLDGLERLGLLADVEAEGFTKQDYCYLVYKTGERIEWSLAPLAEHTRHPYNVHLGQHRLAEITLRHLARYPHAKVLWGHRVTGVTQDEHGVTVQAQTASGATSVRADWAIGCDGARSAVRQALGLAFDGITWPERFIATNIRYDFSRHGYARSTLVIDDQYAAVIAKIDNDGLWRCTYCEDAALPDDEASVLARMKAYFNVILPGANDIELVQYSPYRMHQRAAERFREGRVLLAGDAAHSTNPTGGLGLASGLFDSYVLYEALAAVILGELDESVLTDYAEQRRRTFLEVASPQASENKRVVYRTRDDAGRLEDDLRELRRMKTDRQALMDRLLFTRKLETPSLAPWRRADAEAAIAQPA